MSRRAFTLLEMLIAIALTIALLAAMFSFFWDLLATRQQIIEETSRRRAVDTLIEGLERDLLTAVAGDAVFGAGVAGDDSAIRILSRGVPARLAERPGGLGFADLERAEYRFDEAGRTLSARRVAVRGGEAGPAPGFAPLGGNVHRVRFRYHDGRAWVDSFDSLRAAALPRAVEVAIWFDAPPGETLADQFAEPPARAERLTFGPDGGFDERAFAIESDLELLDEPRPDRVRVIGVPDAAGPADAPAVEGEEAAE